jgi:hypothetical protein
MSLKCFYDSLLVSILKGWALNKPQVTVNEYLSHGMWKKMRKEVKEWTEFYNTVRVTNTVFIQSNVSRRKLNNLTRILSNSIFKTNIFERMKTKTYILMILEKNTFTYFYILIW